MDLKSAEVDVQDTGRWSGVSKERLDPGSTKIAIEVPSSVTSPDEEAVRKVETAGDLISLDSIDPALTAKMHLVNNAIDQLGWTPYHVKLFFLNGFGYAVDSLLTFLIGIAQNQVILQFDPPFKRGAIIGFYLALLFGALFWGGSADIIGRRWAFNLSLLLSSIFAIAAGGANSYPAWGSLVAVSAFGSGGNLILDTTVFLEYLPSNKQWFLTLLAVWWGVGQALAGLIAWGFMSDYSCPSDGSIPCTNANNSGWRYLYYTSGAVVFAMSIARVLIIRFHETPKFLLCQGRDADVVETFQLLSAKYNRPCSLTLEQLTACGQISTAHSNKRWSVSELKVHVKGLFVTRKMALSTVLVWVSWALIGLGYSLYYVFLPEYLANRATDDGTTSNFILWRDYVISNTCAIFGPLFAGFMCQNRYLGRKWTMVIGAFLTMAFFFAYTAVRTSAQNLGFSCTINVVLNLYFATLYAYTVEVLPSAHRGTGNGIAVSCNRLMGTMSAVVGTYASTSSAVPIYICAAILGAAGIVAMFFPFETRNKRSI